MKSISSGTVDVISHHKNNVELNISSTSVMIWCVQCAVDLTIVFEMDLDDERRRPDIIER